MISVDTGIQNQLQSELLEGESFLWTGRPKKGIIFELKHVLFSIIVFVWLWVMFSMISNTNSLTNYLLFILFGVVAFFMCMARPLFEFSRRHNNVYGITENRVLIKLKPLSNVSSYDIKNIPQLDIEVTTGGTGTITLNTDTSWFGRKGIRFKGSPDLPALRMIYNVREVHALLSKIKSSQASYT